MRNRRLACALLLAVAACGGGHKEPAAPSVQRQAALPPDLAAAAGDDAATRRDRFCAALARIVDAEPAAFAPLRAGGAEDGSEAWEGGVVPSGLRECRVDGSYRPAARYVCRGESVAGPGGEALLPAYRALAADVDVCLRRPIWYPSRWRQGRDFAFAGGERQTVWRDGSTGPKATVALKVEEDLGQGGVHFLRLAVATDRD